MLYPEMMFPLLSAIDKNPFLPTVTLMVCVSSAKVIKESLFIFNPVIEIPE
ncbi:hypothetical protein AA106556_1425 [Neokomagataea tanensis NBRC 106556]|uniref:Uncharacterized protein n=1 Tax=Neokomagataea tanensis NBRC 106556 TaxID=1223519 RepID=A0ABQ0QJV5_9PROT|nr:hypothetical protein AA106556_1425 [Neokomagataea tanensis NBRC 106556]